MHDVLVDDAFVHMYNINTATTAIITIDRTEGQLEMAALKKKREVAVG